MRAKKVPDVDETDLRIVQKLVIGQSSEPRSDRATVEEVARALGIHSNTVAARIRKLTKHQVLLPMTVQLQPHNLGIDVAHIFFPVPAERRTPQLAAKFLATPGAHYFFHYVEGWTLILYGKTVEEIRPRVAKLEASAGVAGQWDVVASRDWNMEEHTSPSLDGRDLRILAAMLGNARLSLSMLAKRVGLPDRTVRRRHERLFREKALRYIPHGTTPTRGMVTGYLIADVPAGKARTDAIRLVQGFARDYWSGRVMDRSLHYWMFARDVGGISLQAAGVRSVPGVTNVRVRILERFEISPTFAVFAVQLLGSVHKQ